MNLRQDRPRVASMCTDKFMNLAPSPWGLLLSWHPQKALVKTLRFFGFSNSDNVVHTIITLGMILSTTYTEHPCFFLSSTSEDHCETNNNSQRVSFRSMSEVPIQGARNILIKISKPINPHTTPIAYPVCVRTHVPCPSILSLPANKPSANLAWQPTCLPKVGKMSLQPDGPSW